MCGIIGSVNISDYSNPKNLEWIKSNIEFLKHRGPDQDKIWVSGSNKIIFGHTKLSIIDLSEKNHQPMKDELNKICLTFNGEIYNFIELKKLLNKNHRFETTSDTEVIIKSYLEWGEDFVNKLEGMFSFALLDEKKNILYFARDRNGEKPFFYTIKNENIYFSSELRSFYNNSIINSKILNDFLLNGFAQNQSDTILKNIIQLGPAEILKIELNNKKISKKRYWKFEIKKNDGNQNILKNFEDVITRSLEKCLRSDVKSCITLSGGLDSSLITALASTHKKIDTFSIIYKNKKFDESNHISKIAKHFKTNHNEVEIDNFSLDTVLEILEQFDLPILDSSIIPSYILFNNLKKNNYKVAIGGDGGDEIFGGYNHYKLFFQLDNIKKKFSFFNFNILNKLLKKFENYNFKGSQYVEFLKKEVSVYKIPFFFKSNMRKKILKNEHFFNVEHIKNNDDGQQSVVRQSQNIDFNYTLPLSLLNKLDRCSMLNSVESRSPFLSKEIVEFSCKYLEVSDLVSLKDKKVFLKKFSKKFLPNNFIYNRKHGFSFPFIDILKNEKERSKIEDILTSEDSIFDKSYVKKLLKFATKSFIRSELIFALLKIQVWKKKNKISI